MTEIKLQHEDEDDFTSQVTVQYDGRTTNLPVQENGVVEVDNKLFAEELQESHGGFEVIEGSEDDLPDYILQDKTVDEVEEYIGEVEDVDRLKELREKEDRKTAVELIDNRISQVKNQKPTDVEAEEVEQDENQEQTKESEDEDGSQNEK